MTDWYKIYCKAFGLVKSKFPHFDNFDVEDCASGAVEDGLRKALPGFELNHTLRKAICLALDLIRYRNRRRDKYFSSSKYNSCNRIEAVVMLNQLLLQLKNDSHKEKFIMFLITHKGLTPASVSKTKKRLRKYIDRVY